MLTIPEALALGQQLGTLSVRTTTVLLDDDTRQASSDLWTTIQSVLSKDSPGKRKVTKDERRAILVRLFGLMRSLLDVDTDEARALLRDLVSFSRKLVQDVLD